MEQRLAAALLLLAFASGYVPDGLSGCLLAGNPPKVQKACEALSLLCRLPVAR